MKPLAAAASLRVVTWNLHGAPGAPKVRRRFGRAARWITHGSLAQGQGPPDLVLLQEVWTSAQEAQLREALGPGYELVGVPRGWILPRKGGLLALVRRGGPLARVRASFHEFATEAPAWRLWEGDGFADKGVQRIELRLADDTLVVFNTHLQAGYQRADHAPVRAAQLDELRRLVAAEPPGALLLAAGDLNTQPAELAQRFLSQSPGWRDLSESLRTRRECWSPPDASGREEWIDYVLGRDGEARRLRVAHADCVASRPADVPYSDHPGLDLDLAIESTPLLSRWLVPVLAARLAEPATRREWLASATLLALAAAGRIGR